MSSVSVDIVDPPLILFNTRTNTELGAAGVTFDGDEIVFTGVCKKVTEGMALT